MINETRERFIRTIAEHIDPARIVEIHFFPSIRQGPMETGVAVIAATPSPQAGAVDAPQAELPLESAALPGAATPTPRTEVFTAAYRWTRKGPERGHWTVDVTTEAHAPLTTVETVVRGVQERAGEALDAHRMTGDEVRAVLGEGAIAQPSVTAMAEPPAPVRESA